MARDIDVNRVVKWAGLADANVDPTVDGLTRSTGWPASYSTPGGDVPTRETFNELFREITAAIVELNTRGLLGWHADVAYVHPAIVAGSDGALYRSVRDSTGADPTADTGDDWLPLIPTVSVGNASQTARGIIEIASEAEARGTDATRAITPFTLNSRIGQRVDGNHAFSVSVRTNAGSAVSAGVSDPKFVSVVNVSSSRPFATVNAPASDRPPYLIVQDLTAGVQSEPYPIVYRGGHFENFRLHPSQAGNDFSNDDPIYLEWDSTNSTWAFADAASASYPIPVGFVLFAQPPTGSGLYDLVLDFSAWLAQGPVVAAAASGGGFDLHEDVPTQIGSLSSSDRMLISDESASGEPNRYTTLSALRPFFRFDLHDDVASAITAFSSSDRMLISDESLSGDPNRYTTLAALKLYFGFDLHDDVTSTTTTLSSSDRMLISDEGTSGDPNRYITLATLRGFVASPAAQLARAWAIASSTSISDDYNCSTVQSSSTWVQINFTTAMSDTTYAVVFNGGGGGGPAPTRGTSFVRFNYDQGSGFNIVHFAVFNT